MTDKADGRKTLTGTLSMPGAMRTHLWRWRERMLTTPPVLGWQLILQALRNRHPAITWELPKEAPLFVLATGRSGTYTLAHLLAMAPGVMAWHEPLPDFHRLARQVYFNPDADRHIVSEALLLARAPLWQTANMADKRYVEASNYASFLAPFIRHMIPEARFLHLTRAPLPFARSATAFGWYTVPRIGAPRLSPRPDSPAAADWDNLEPFAKNAWLWHKVNSFSRDFLSTLPPGQGLHLRAEDLFAADPGSLSQLFALVDCDAPAQRRMERMLDHQLNAGRYRQDAAGPQASDADAEQHHLLHQKCEPLAHALGYSGLAG